MSEYEVTHDGDCWIFAANGVCTCGLLHRIVRHPESEEYEKNAKQIDKHLCGLYHLNGLPEDLTKVKKPKSKFVEHLERCSKIVSTWPKWKQKLLGGKNSHD